MSATISLTGPSTTPGAPQVTPQAMDAAVNTALAANYAVAAQATADEAQRAVITETYLGNALAGKLATTGDASATMVVPIGAVQGIPLATHLQYMLTPLNFGTNVGTGGDDATVLQAALTACAGKATLRIPPGMLCNVGPTLHAPANTELQLDGGITALPSSGPFRSVIDLTGPHIRIHGTGFIDGNRANQPGTGNAYSSAGIGCGATPNLYDIQISGLEIRNVVNWPINLTIGVSDVVIENCTLHDSGNSCEVNLGSTCRFLNNTVYNIDDGGVVIYGGCTDCRVDENSVFNCISGIGIYSDNAQTGLDGLSSVSNNHVSNCKNYGIAVSGVLGGATQVSCLVQGNLCWNNAQSGIAGCGSFKFTNCKGLLVSGNYATGDVGDHPYSFWLNGPLDDCVFTGNKVTNSGNANATVGSIAFACTYAGGAGCTNIIFTNNTVTDDRGSATGTSLAFYGDGHFFSTGCVFQDNHPLGTFKSASPVQPNVANPALVVVEGYLATNASDRVKTIPNIATLTAKVGSTTGWLETLVAHTETIAQLDVISLKGQAGGCFGTRTADDATTAYAESAWAVGGFGINNNTAYRKTAYGAYLEARRTSAGVLGFTWGLESSVANQGDNLTVTPFGLPNGATAPYRASIRGVTTGDGANVSHVFGIIGLNTLKFNSGFVFFNDCIAADATAGFPICFDLTVNQGILWRSGGSGAPAASVRSTTSAASAWSGGDLIFNDGGFSLLNKAGAGIKTTNTTVYLTGTVDVANGLLCHQSLGVQGAVTLSGLSTYAGNAAAASGGLPISGLYVNSSNSNAITART